MVLHTASEGITFSKKLENESAGFYEELARRYTQDAETFVSFAKDNKKNIAQIERSYYGVITDAIEGGYAFNIDPDDYTIKSAVQDGASYNDIFFSGYFFGNFDFKLPEGSFAVLTEYLGDGLSRFFLNQLIQLDKIFAQFPGEFPPHHRFPRPHETDKGDISLHVSPAF